MQIERFSVLLRNIHEQEGSHRSTAVVTTLTTAKSLLEELQRLIQAKLLKNSDGTSRFRKRVWARNRHKIHKMQYELTDIRANLTAVMGASNLLVTYIEFDSVSTNHSLRAFACRAERAINSMNQGLGQSEQASSKLDEHLSSIQYVLSQTYHAISAQGLAMNQLLQSNMSFRCQYFDDDSRFQDSRPLWQRRKPQDAGSLSHLNDSKLHTVIAEDLPNTAEQPGSHRECKPMIKRRKSYSPILRRSTYTRTVEPIRSLTNCFSRIVHDRSTTASFLSCCTQLI